MGDDMGHAPQKRGSREQLVSSLFKAVADEGTVFLRATSLRRFAELLGFEGSADDWAIEYKEICGANGWDPVKGASAYQFTKFVNQPDSGGYCTDDSLRSMLASLEKAKQLSAPEAEESQPAIQPVDIGPGLLQPSMDPVGPSALRRGLGSRSPRRRAVSQQIADGMVTATPMLEQSMALLSQFRGGGREFQYDHAPWENFNHFKGGGRGGFHYNQAPHDIFDSMFKGGGRGFQRNQIPHETVDGIFLGTIATCNWTKHSGWITADPSHFPPQVQEKMDAMINLAKDKGQMYQERPLFFRFEDCQEGFTPRKGVRISCKIYTTYSQAAACEISACDA